MRSACFQLLSASALFRRDPQVLLNALQPELAAIRQAVDAQGGTLVVIRQQQNQILNMLENTAHKLRLPAGLPDGLKRFWWRSFTGAMVSWAAFYERLRLTLEAAQPGALTALAGQLQARLDLQGVQTAVRGEAAVEALLREAIDNTHDARVDPDELYNFYDRCATMAPAAGSMEAFVAAFIGGADLLALSDAEQRELQELRDVLRPLRYEVRAASQTSVLRAMFNACISGSIATLNDCCP